LTSYYILCYHFGSQNCKQQSTPQSKKRPRIAEHPSSRTSSLRDKKLATGQAIFERRESPYQVEVLFGISQERQLIHLFQSAEAPSKGARTTKGIHKLPFFRQEKRNIKSSLKLVGRMMDRGESPEKKLQKVLYGEQASRHKVIHFG